MTNTARDPAAARQMLLSLLAALPDNLVSFRETAQALGAGDPDAWSRLFEEAIAHGVIGVIAPHLLELELPTSTRQTLERRLPVETLWHQHMIDALELSVSTLTRQGIKVGALKGPVLAERLYADPRARPCMDVDLLVRREDIERAASALRQAGCEGDSEISAAYLLQHAHHLHFSRPAMPAIELHFHAYAGFGVVLPANVLMDRATEYEIRDGLSVLVLSPEDEFIYLAVHAAGHSFIRLLWLYDLKLLLRRYPSLDWNTVATRAKAFGVARPVAYTTRLLERWLGVKVGEGLQSRERRDVRERVADRLLAEVSAPQQSSVRDNLGGLVFTSLLCDSLASSAWLLQHHVFRTTRRRLHRLAPRLLPEAWAG